MRRLRRILRFFVAALVMTQLAVILLHYMGLLDMYAVSAWIKSGLLSLVNKLTHPF